MLSPGFWWFSLSEGCVAGSWSSWCPPGPSTHTSSGLSLQRCFPVGEPQGYWWMSYYSSSRAAYYISFSWTSQGSPLPISPFWCSSFEWQHGHLFCKALLPVSHHLQTSCACTLSYHPGKLYSPRINLWAASPMTGLQLVFMSMMTILWAQSFSCISVHLTSTCLASISSACLQGCYGDSVHCSSLIHPAVISLYKSYQVS